MGQIAKFLIALERLARKSGLKIEDAYKFAKQEFGEITPLLRKQIQNVFDKIKKPVVGKPGKKEGTVLPMVKESAKKAEGIETLDPKMGDVENLPNPKRPGGSLDPATGITRALARRILNRKGIEIGKKDPIDVFTDTFGEAISDVNNLAEEMIEIDSRGGGMKDMDQMLEADGLFDIEIPTNPQKGLTNDELLDLVKKTEEEEVLKDFDPTGRKPNATGGLTRTSYALGKGPVLPSDEDPINPFGPKPTGPVLPDKSMMASDDANERLLEQLFEQFLDEGFSPEEAAKKAREAFYDRDYDAKAKQAPSIKLASAYDYNSYEHKINELKAAYKRYKKGSATGGRKGTMTFEQFAPKFAEENFSTGGRVQAASGGLADILKV